MPPTKGLLVAFQVKLGSKHWLLYSLVILLGALDLFAGQLNVGKWLLSHLNRVLDLLQGLVHWCKQSAVQRVLRNIFALFVTLVQSLGHQLHWSVALVMSLA